MCILAIERELPVPARPDLSDILRQEANSVWELQKHGVIRDIWFTAGDRRAVVMLECASATDAREHLSNLPLVQRGMIDFTLLELHSYDGFERLFATGATPAVVKHEEAPEY